MKATCMRKGFEDITKLLGIHTEHFGTFDMVMRGLKHQVSNNIHVASNVLYNTVDEFTTISVDLHAFVKSSAEDVVKAIEVHMEADRNLQPHGMKWTY
ncbi:hypothetical protein CJ030_MR6G002439 [Morella rubra]|nr:hypothetical protein CJ030_MR6G002439 [Morella rubra]